MSKDKYPCEMIYDEDAAGYVTEIIKVENQVMDAEILLYKQGESAVPLEDGTWTFEPAGLAGVWFGVYAAEEVLNAQGEEVVKKRFPGWHRHDGSGGLLQHPGSIAGRQLLLERIKNHRWLYIRGEQL